MLSKNNLHKIVIIFFSISLNMCFGCYKEQSHRDGPFGYPQHMLCLRNKKIIFSYTFLSGGVHYTYQRVGHSLEFPNKDVLSSTQRDISLTTDYLTKDYLPNNRLSSSQQIILSYNRISDYLLHNRLSHSPQIIFSYNRI